MTTSTRQHLELVTFMAGRAACGVNIQDLNEINRIMLITPVPQAPEHVIGILNLRGQIVTVIDLERRLGINDAGAASKPCNLIVHMDGEAVGLRVREINDVVQAEEGQISPPPPNLKGIQGRYFSGVLSHKDRLIGIVDLTAVLDMESV
jgi:purine-binding chemotaxis protein CheW